MLKREHGGSSDAKYQISLGLPVGTVINCADSTGAKNPCIVSMKGINTSHCWYRWHGDDHSQESQTWAQKEGAFYSGDLIAEVVSENSQSVSLFWRQCRGHSEQ